MDGSAGNSLNPSQGIVGGTPCSEDLGSYNNTYNGISLDGTAGATLDSSEPATYSFSGYISDNYGSTVASSYQSTMDMSGFQNTEVAEPSLLGSAWNSLTQWADQNVVQPIQEALNTPIQSQESTSVANLLADNVPGMTKDEVENGLSNMGLTTKDINSTTNMIGDDPDAISNWATANGINPATVTLLDADNALLNNSVENLRNPGDVIVQGVDSSTMGNMLDLSPKARAEFDIVGNSVSNILAPAGLALTAAISPEAVPYVGAGIVFFSQVCSDLSATSRVTTSYLVGTVGNILSLVPGMKIAQGWTDEVKLGANVISKQIGLGNGLYGTVGDLQTLNEESKVQKK
ncbi:hypothetical protein PIPA1_16380 [Pelosinus sp. IPA-1]|nr:hypothetical protein PIPA1_16380 [Pelosinus sp. IPA-1]